ncbi:hypothetical protein PMAYCL1PPCAC_05865, partial [Pristionchus mayeri]
FHENSTRDSIPRGLLSVSRKQRGAGFNANDEKYHTCCGAHVTSCARFFLGFYIFGITLDLLRDFHLVKLIIIPIIFIGVIGVFAEQRLPLIAFIIIDTAYAIALAIVTALGLLQPSTRQNSSDRDYPSRNQDDRSFRQQQEGRSHMSTWNWSATSVINLALTACFWAFLAISLIWKYFIFWKMAEYLKDRKKAIKSARKYREPTHIASAPKDERSHPAYGESEMEAAQKVIDYHNSHEVTMEILT